MFSIRTENPQRRQLEEELGVGGKERERRYGPEASAEAAVPDLGVDVGKEEKRDARSNEADSVNGCACQ